MSNEPASNSGNRGAASHRLCQPSLQQTYQETVQHASARCAHAQGWGCLRRPRRRPADKVAGDARVRGGGVRGGDSIRPSLVARDLRAGTEAAGTDPIAGAHTPPVAVAQAARAASAEQSRARPPASPSPSVNGCFYRSVCLGDVSPHFQANVSEPARLEGERGTRRPRAGRFEPRRLVTDSVRNPLQMAAVAKPGVEKAGVEAEVAQVHRIRITLTSRNVKNLEKGEHHAA